ncbi:MAG: PilZ domain-containing protein [Deltaproteobacteria bacterium]|nr:PilZ domain-containing protein [Deltaproteobacteria bacterium]
MAILGFLSKRQDRTQKAESINLLSRISKLGGVVDIVVDGLEFRPTKIVSIDDDKIKLVQPVPRLSKSQVGDRVKLAFAIDFKKVAGKESMKMGLDALIVDCIDEGLKLFEQFVIIKITDFSIRSFNKRRFFRANIRPAHDCQLIILNRSLSSVRILDLSAGGAGIIYKSNNENKLASGMEIGLTLKMGRDSFQLKAKVVRAAAYQANKSYNFAGLLFKLKEKSRDDRLIAEKIANFVQRVELEDRPPGTY